MDGTVLAVFLFGTFLGGLTSGIAGFAMGLVVSGIWLHVLTPLQTATLIVGFGLVTQGYAIWKLRGALDWWAVMPFILGGAFGVPVGTMIVAVIDPAATRSIVGGLLIAYSIWGLAQRRFTPIATDVPRDLAIGGLVAASYASDVAGLWTEAKNTQVKDSLRTAYGGTPDQQPAVYEERSVLRNLISLPAQMPVALYATYSDSMIPVAQQTRLRDALALRGNPMLYVVIPGDHRLESLDEGFAFVLNRLGVR